MLLFYFRYAVLVADRSEAGRRPVADHLARASSLLVIGQIPARCRSATSLGPVCDQDSVMEVGFYLALNGLYRTLTLLLILDHVTAFTEATGLNRNSDGTRKHKLAILSVLISSVFTFLSFVPAIGSWLT